MAGTPFYLKDFDGINLMRAKGAPPKGALFDLKNGWITPKRTAKARPGSVLAKVFPATSKGVVGFEGRFHTFSHSGEDPSGDAEVVVHILRHPTALDTPIESIRRVFPFLGRLYVVAKFTDGTVRHYWVEDPEAWAPSTAYQYGAVVQPTLKTGMYFENLSTGAVNAWQSNSVIVAGDVRQPSVTNGFKYTATAVTGTAPIRTGNTEPTWPTTIGATVVERRYVTDGQGGTGGSTPAPPPSDGGGGGGGSYGGGGGARDEYFNYHIV